MILTGTTQSLEVERSSTADVDIICEYTQIDKSGSTVTTAESAQASYNSIATSTLLSAPGASIDYIVTGFYAANQHASASNRITIKKDVGGIEYRWRSFNLGPGEAAQYEKGRGWTIFDANGLEKINGLGVGGKSSVLMNPSFATANLTGTKTITSASTFAVYVGKAPRSLTSAQVRCRVTTAMATITWGEVAIAKGAINIGANPSLTVVGYADVSAVFNSTGQKSVTVNVSAGQVIGEGDDLWVLIGNQATTAAVMRAQSIADDLQVGIQGSLATRPSLNVGSAQAYTIEGATTLAAWVALVV